MQEQFLITQKATNEELALLEARIDTLTKEIDESDKEQGRKGR